MSTTVDRHPLARRVDVRDRGGPAPVRRRTLFTCTLGPSVLALGLCTPGLVVTPAHALPASAAHPVAPGVDSVAMGSVQAPQGATVVTTDGVVTGAGPEAEVRTGASAAPGTSTKSGTPGPDSSPTVGPAGRPRHLSHTTLCGGVTCTGRQS